MNAAGLGVAVTTAAGRLARRADGVLFIASTAFEGWPEIVQRFLTAADAEDARDAVTEATLAQSFRIDPFVMVTWADQVVVVVLGDATVTTDLPTLPMLSGRGSASWVEHRAPRSTSACRLWAGAAAVPSTDLAAGVVPADGFDLQLGVGDRAAAPTSAAAPAAASAIVSDAMAPLDAAPAAHATPPMPVGAGHAAAAPTPAPAPAPAPAEDRRATLAALHAASGGDWMEESLGLPLVLGPSAHDGSAPSIDFDPDITLEPERVTSEVMTDEPGPELGPVAGDGVSSPGVQARRCTNQHVNPPTAALCRLCGALIDPRQPVESVPQPALGSMVLPDGRSLPIDGTYVLGRNPDATDARVPEGSSLPLDVGLDVSRTHVVVRAEGWSLEAIDCASSGHTVLAAGALTPPEPVMLEPWLPYELAVGDVLYLGGPTQIRIVR